LYVSRIDAVKLITCFSLMLVQQSPMLGVMSIREFSKRHGTTSKSWSDIFVSYCRILPVWSH